MDRRGSGVDVESRGCEEGWLLGREEDGGIDGRGWDVAEGCLVRIGDQGSRDSDAYCGRWGGVLLDGCQEC